MLAPEHAVWYALIHWLTAFVWAVEPCALSEPEAQEIAAELLPPLPPGVGEELLSVPHAASASVAVSARPARMPCRWSFTCRPFTVHRFTGRQRTPDGDGSVQPAGPDAKSGR